MEYRRVKLLSKETNKGGKGHEVPSSTFIFEGKTYTLTGSKQVQVPLYVANAWISADANVAISPER